MTLVTNKETPESSICPSSEAPVNLADEEIRVHGWKIESATGPTSPGFCIYCGINREFKNSVDSPGKKWGTRDE